MKKQAWVFVFIVTVLLIIVGTTIIKNGRITGEVVIKEEVLSDGIIALEEVPTPPVEEPKIEEILPITVEAKIINFAFVPTTIEINAGDTVVWENRDTVRHTVTSDSGDEMNSRLLGKGERYSHTFNTAGTYNYHCTPHPYMKGKVVVK